MKKTVKQVAAAALLGFGLAASITALPDTAEAAKKAPVKLNIANMTIEGVEGAKAAEIKRLIPEINQKELNVKKLSKQIQLVNDNKLFKVTTELNPVSEGGYNLVVKVSKVKTDNFTFSVNNTGNNYSGNWRAGLTYAKSDLSGYGDTLGLAYVTSPNHLNDVHQVGVTYKMLMPRLGDTAYISYSYSDVDMGVVGGNGPLELSTTGKAHSVGVHYQHNMKYSKSKKQILDFGIDHKRNKNRLKYTMGGASLLSDEHDVRATVASLTYTDFTRWKNQAFVYSVGYYQNLHGDKNVYEKYRKSSDKDFKYLRASVNYQYRTKSDWIFGIRATGQYTDDNLIYTEQLGAGGANSIRGFKERVASGDKGIVGSLEIYAPQLKCMPNQRFLLFLDAGALSNNHYNIAESSRHLASFGIGYRFFEKDGLSVNLNYAKVLKKGKVNMSNNYLPWSLSVSYSF